MNNNTRSIGHAGSPCNHTKDLHNMINATIFEVYT